MIDIEGTDKKVKQVDSLLTSITALLKKHWLILIVIAIGVLCYWLTTYPDQKPVEVHTEIPVDGNIGNEESFSDDTVVDEDLEQDTTFVEVDEYVEQDL